MRTSTGFKNWQTLEKKIEEPKPDYQIIQEESEGAQTPNFNQSLSELKEKLRQRYVITESTIDKILGDTSESASCSFR